jgi:hypothetical protein
MDVPVTRQFETGRQNRSVKVYSIHILSLSSLRFTTAQFTTMPTHDICIVSSMNRFKKGCFFTLSAIYNGLNLYVSALNK